MSRRAIFFDRDGVLNVNSGYVGSVDRFVWTDGAIDAVRLINDADWLVVVVTNQSGVGRGYYTLQDVSILHDWMQGELGRHGARIDAFYVCPFHEDAVVPEYRVGNHFDRKPNPGMILRAIDQLCIDPDQSILIGDSTSDIAAATAAGVRGVLFSGNNLRELVEKLTSGQSECPSPAILKNGIAE
jgi:D-glycero-D-manno-heptose 1,7-bisphosphate phosphatase